MNETGSDGIMLYRIEETDANVLICIYIIIMIIGLTANVSIVIAVLRKRSLQKKQHLILLNLIICDLLTTLLSAPYYIYSVAVPAPHKSVSATNLCKGYLFFSYAFGYVAIQSMLLISLDRYIAIVHPYLYHKHMNSKKIPPLSAALCWLVPFLACFPSTISENWLEYDGRPGGFCGVQWSHVNKIYVIIVVGLLFIIPSLVVFFTNIRVYKIARRQMKVSPEQSANRKISNQSQLTLSSEDDENEIRKKMSSETSSSPGQRMNMFVMTGQSIRQRVSSMSLKKKKVTRLSKRDVHIAVATLLLICLYLLSWLPFVVPRILSTLGLNVPRWLISYTPPFVFSSVAWDPLLILWCRNEIRREVRKLFCMVLSRLTKPRLSEERKTSRTIIENPNTLEGSMKYENTPH